jgi:hypothetical protein
MAAPRNLHRSTTRFMSVLLVVLGIAMIGRTIAAGASAGGLAFGFVIGVLFIAAGLGRLYISGLSGRRGPA